MLFAPTVDLTDMTQVLWLIVTFLLLLLLLTIVLKIALGFVDKAKHEKFGEVFVTCLLIIVVVAIVYVFIPGYIALIVGLILMWLIISARHNTGFVTAIGVSILAFIIAIILLIVIGILLKAVGITLVTFF